LITAEETRLVEDDQENAHYVIRALREVPKDEREPLVHLITAPETRLVTDDRENASGVIGALTQVPADEREAWVKRKLEENND
jgi:Mor family transcriptional regulator